MLLRASQFEYENPENVSNKFDEWISQWANAMNGGPRIADFDTFQ